MELSFSRGVYPDMFEQSILTNEPMGRKSGALFASASAQIVGVGVLLLIPLIYTEALPVAPLPLTLPLPVSQAPEPQAEATRVSHQTTRSRTLTVPFRMPVLSSRAPSAAVETTIDTGAPQLTGTAYGLQAATDFGLADPHIARPLEPPPAPAAEPVTPAAAPIRVSGSVQAAKIVRKAVPQYPPLARQARVSGVVRLLGVIAKDGSVQRLEVISGHPLLQKAALDAVSQWLYHPTLLSGEPVEVFAPIDVIFTLSQ
jgi:protein TonB